MTAPAPSNNQCSPTCAPEHDDTTEPGPSGDGGDWQDRASCRGLPADLFFSTSQWNQRRGLAICRTCPVRDECLDHAIRVNEKFGIWGGTTYRERRRLRVTLGITSRTPTVPADLDTL